MVLVLWVLLTIRKILTHLPFKFKLSVFTSSLCFTLSMASTSFPSFFPSDLSTVSPILPFCSVYNSTSFFCYPLCMLCNTHFQLNVFWWYCWFNWFTVSEAYQYPTQQLPVSFPSIDFILLVVVSFCASLDRKLLLSQASRVTHMYIHKHTHTVLFVQMKYSTATIIIFIINNLSNVIFD